MVINVIRLKNSSLTNEDYIKDNEYIASLNDALFDNEHEILEGISDPIYSLLFVESNNVFDAFKRVKDRLVSPVVILSGKAPFAFKMALEINSYLTNEGYHSLVANGTDEENAALISEIIRVIDAKSKIDGANIALIGDYHNHSVLNKLDIQYFESHFHVNIIKISNSELEEAVNGAKKANILHKKLIDMMIKDKHDHTTFTRIYSGLDYLVDKYNLSGICFNADKYNDFDYPLAALFNERGISMILENDLNGLVSLMMLNALQDTVALYGTLNNVSLSDNNIYLYLDMVPFNMLNQSGSINNGDVTLFKIGYDKGRFMALNGKINSSKEKDGYIEVEIHLEDRELFDLFREPIGGTLAISYGDLIGSLYAYDNIILFENKKNKKK